MTMTPTPLRHTPSGTAQDQLQLHQVLRAGSSPFHRGKPQPQPLDRSKIVGCLVDGCYKRFLNQAFLDRHQADEHAPKPRPARGGAPRSDESVEAITLFRETVLARIDNGALKPGNTIVIGRLANELAISRYRAELAIEVLVKEGALVYVGTSFSRRAVVASRELAGREMPLPQPQDGPRRLLDGIRG
jgi:hypothetical protein